MVDGELFQYFKRMSVRAELMLPAIKFDENKFKKNIKKKYLNFLKTNLQKKIKKRNQKNQKQKIKFDNGIDVTRNLV